LAIDVVAPPRPSEDRSPHPERQSAYRNAIKAFADVAVGLREAVDRDALLHLIARSMCELVGTSRASLYLREERTGLFKGQVGHADHDIDLLVKRLTCGIEADGFTREIVRLRAPVVIKDPARDERAVRSTMRDWGVRSMMGVPMLLRDEVIGIFFLDSEDEVRDFSELDQDLASAFAELAAVAISQGELLGKVRSSHRTVAQQNQALRRAAAVDERFTQLVISGGSLRQIADVVTELTDRKCAIFNPEMRMLTAPAVVEGAPAEPLEKVDAGRSPEVAEAIAELSPDTPAVIGPFPRSGINVRLLVAPVTVRDGRWASLVLTEQGGRFNDFDLLISRRVASIIALEMSAERRAALAEWNARASLAAELIRGNRDVGHVERRANFLGIRLDTPHVLCLVTWREGDEPEMPDAEEVAAAVSRQAPDLSLLATGVIEGIALIADLPPDLSVLAGIERIKQHVAEACLALDPHGRLIAALSMRCTSAPDYVRAYEEARQVVSCIDTYCPPGTMAALSADDLGPGRLLLAGTDPTEARRFAGETLGPLLEEDAPPELLETLICFFDHGRSVRHSAAFLDVHENTIRYRIGKIEELTGLVVASDCDAQLSAQIALLVLRLQGALPPPSPSPRQAPAIEAEAAAESG
jgi:sugar diacid utilization regulator